MILFFWSLHVLCLPETGWKIPVGIIFASGSFHLLFRLCSTKCPSNHCWEVSPLGAGCWAGCSRGVGVLCRSWWLGWKGHSPDRASAPGMTVSMPWESACSGFFIQYFPSFLLCNKTTTKGLDSTMCLDQKLPFEIPVSTFPTLAKAMKQQSIGTLKQRWEPVQCTGSPLSRTVHVAPESVFLLMGIFPSTALLSRSSLTSCDPHLQYLLGAVFLSAAQSLHSETQTFPIRRGSAGVVCNSSMQVRSFSMWLTWAPSLGMLLCLALGLLSSWSHSRMSQAVASKSLQCDHAP